MQYVAPIRRAKLSIILGQGTNGAIHLNSIFFFFVGKLKADFPHWLPKNFNQFFDGPVFLFYIKIPENCACVSIIGSFSHFEYLISETLFQGIQD